MTTERGACRVGVSAEMLCLQILGCLWRDGVPAEMRVLTRMCQGSGCFGSPALLSTKYPSPLGSCIEGC